VRAGKETVVMIMIGVIKINTDIMVVTMIEGGSLNALVTAMATGLVTMSMQATNGAATS
jgi:formiminotetrahydrofolate cyclodeaminase